MGASICCSYDAWNGHPSYDVPDFHRIVVHGRTVRVEYLELAVTPGGHQPTTATSFGSCSWSQLDV